MKVILYTTHCPQCKGVETILKIKKIQYTECTDVDKMLSLGIQQAPVLSVDGQLFRGKEIYDWVHKVVS